MHKEYGGLCSATFDELPPPRKAIPARGMQALRDKVLARFGDTSVPIPRFITQYAKDKATRLSQDDVDEIHAEWISEQRERKALLSG